MGRKHGAAVDWLAYDKLTSLTVKFLMYAFSKSCFIKTGHIYQFRNEQMR